MAVSTRDKRVTLSVRDVLRKLECEPGDTVVVTRVGEAEWDDDGTSR